jgi:hypothetical protein
MRTGSADLEFQLPKRTENIPFRSILASRETAFGKRRAKDRDFSRQPFVG